MFKRLGWVFLALAVVAMPTLVEAKGGSGGGGTKTTTRVTGYITAIDYTNSTMIVGASYYGSGAVKINSSTKIQVNGESVEFGEVLLNDWAEVNYDFTTKIATKVSITR